MCSVGYDQVIHGLSHFGESGSITEEVNSPDFEDLTSNLFESRHAKHTNGTTKRSNGCVNFSVLLAEGKTWTPGFSSDGRIWQMPFALQTLQHCLVIRTYEVHLATVIIAELQLVTYSR